MKIAYPANFEYSETDQAFLVDFPDLPGCITYGETMDEAMLMAQDALSVYLESIMDRDLVFSAPTVIQGAVLISPIASVSFALWLRTKRKESGMTLTDVADKLGVKYQVYQKLENPVTANPTLKTLSKLEKVFNENLLAV